MPPPGASRCRSMGTGGLERRREGIYKAGSLRGKSVGVFRCLKRGSEAHGGFNGGPIICGEKKEKKLTV